MSQYGLAMSAAEVQRYRLMAKVAHEQEAEQWAAAGIAKGANVADLGCGPGEVTRLLADEVGQGGHVWGVDADMDSTSLAETVASDLSNLTIIQADAANTPLRPKSLDVAVARHLLVHNGGREQEIVDHMATLIRPGGHLYLVEFEGTAARLRPSCPDIEDLALRYGALHEQNGNDFAIGLRLPELAERAGLKVTLFEGTYRIVSPPPGVRTPTWAARKSIVEAGLADAHDVARWDAAFQRLDIAFPRPTMFYPIFICIATKS